MRVGTKGNISTNVTNAIYVFIGLIVLFLVVANLYPQAAIAGSTLNSSGAPLGSLFVGGGVVLLIVMAGILLVVIKTAFKK